MTDSNKELVRKVMVAYSTVDEATLDALLAADYIQHSELGPGTEPVKARARQLLAAFPDLHCEIDQCIAEGDLVVTRQTVSGTHRGAFQGLEPTGRKIAFQVMDIWRVENGRLAEHWGVLDQLGLLRQLGCQLVPPPTDRQPGPPERPSHGGSAAQ